MNLGVDELKRNFIPGIERIESVSFNSCTCGPNESKYLCLIAASAVIREVGSYCN